MRGLCRSAGVLLLLVAGCIERPTEEPTPPPDTRSSRFDASTAGSVTGEVTWARGLPDVAPFTVWKLLGSKEQGRFLHDNPNAPLIDPQSRGFAGAVVFLRGVTPEHACPWDLPPVRVEVARDRIHVWQGDVTRRVGFVRRGEGVEMRSTDAEFHSLRASGAAFFTLPFPDPDQPRMKRLDRAGLVELTTAAWWTRAYLFVDDHPYYAQTDARGRFELSRVPPGSYEVVCWAANWNEAAHERDPETSRISRLTFRPPVEKVGTVEVRPGAVSTARFELRGDDFRR
jgi:hypothetical protein